MPPSDIVASRRPLTRLAISATPPRERTGFIETARLALSATPPRERTGFSISATPPRERTTPRTIDNQVTTPGFPTVETVAMQDKLITTGQIMFIIGAAIFGFIMIRRNA